MGASHGRVLRRAAVAEIGQKANAIMARGWEYNGCGDPGLCHFGASFPEEADPAVAEVQALMVIYWSRRRNSCAQGVRSAVRRLIVP